jgi:hypothetical protein
MKSKPVSSRNSDGKAGEPNLDPLTGEPGAHPVGTGVGAAAGGATGAAIGAAGGPVGAVIGSIIGAVAGGLAGKGVAEKVDPTMEEAFWRKNHAGQPYARGRGYDQFERAYQTGITGYAEGRSFADREAELREVYEAKNRSAGDRSLEEEAITQLEWEEARHASQAAYERLSKRPATSPPAAPTPMPTGP